MLSLPVSQLNKVGQALTKRLLRLEIKTIRDLIYHIPLRHEDYSYISKIKDLALEGDVTVYATVELVSSRKSRKSKMLMTEAVVSDETGSLKLMWFNQPYIKKQLVPGVTYYFSGKLQSKFYNQCLVNPSFETEKKDGGNLNTAALLPVYPLTEGITQKQLRFLVKQSLFYIDEIEDLIPEFIKQRRGLIDLKKAFLEIHFPKSFESLAPAQKRIDYDKIFWAQSGICLLKKSLKEYKSPKLKFWEQDTKDFVASLPFEMTMSQKKVSWRILQDLQEEKPMNRLVQGDVGSGKTVVAFLGILNAVKNNFQVVLMAPTEILAKQHYKTALNFFKDYDFEMLLLTRSDKRICDKQECHPESTINQRCHPESTINQRCHPELVEGRYPNSSTSHDLTEKQALECIKNHKAKLIIGTHSIIQEKVKFSDLGLVIVDEQHRFGVKQRGLLRSGLKKSGKTPHYLSMTATPIPRTQALFMYGDLDISIINEMPKGRKKVITKAVEMNQRNEVYAFLRNEINKGRQSFCVCPLIDPSDKLGVKSVEEEIGHLKKDIFPDLEIRSLHGKMKSQEKDEIMKDFKDNKFPILVSTSVIEVGVDIPNVTIMLIEGAERFGLAQLHQFRGRVGRGNDQAYCFLFASDGSSIPGRLKIMETVHNGLELSQKDLSIRGPGEVYGIRQSGDTGVAGNNGFDEYFIKLIEDVREDIFQIFDNSGSSEYEVLLKRMEEETGGIYLE